MTELSINYRDGEVRRAIARLSQRTSDMTPANRNAGEYMLGQVDDRFRTETDPQRRPWQPNSPYTLALKRSEGKILKVLQATGLMRSRVNYRADKKRVVIGIGDRKARKHQLGIGVPKREILGLNQEDERNVVEIYQSYITD